MISYTIDPFAALVLSFLSGVAVGLMLVVIVIRIAVSMELKRLYNLEEVWAQREAVMRLRRRTWDDEQNAETEHGS